MKFHMLMFMNAVLISYAHVHVHMLMFMLMFIKDVLFTVVIPHHLIELNDLH